MPRSELIFSGKFIVLLAALAALPAAALASERAGIRTNEPIYQNPFDLAAGGASITRATQEGTLFSNPALPALGAGLFRWIFLRTAVHAGQQATSLALQVLGARAAPDSQEIMDKAFRTPVHGGMDFAAGVVTSAVSGGVFGSARVDIEGRKFGEQGSPELRGLAHGYGGAIAGYSHALSDYFAVGATTRYQANAEIAEKIGVLSLFDNPDILGRMKDSLQWGTGFGADVGAIAQYRTRMFDLRLGLTVNDIGDTAFAHSLPAWKETWNLGFGATVHSESTAMHCAVDLRDARAQYKEHWTYRTYAGCKLLVQAIIGFGVGLYQGWPTYGFVVNLWLMRLEAGLYAKEVGQQAGTQRRGVLFVAIGTELP